MIGNLEALPIGEDPPWDINAVIEVPMGSGPVKYELDKRSGALFVDRFLHTAMVYPCNYGFVPHTLSEDGDPIDVLVLSEVPVVSGAVIRARPVAVLFMEDEAGTDEKVIATPVDQLSPFYEHVREKEDLPGLLVRQIEHFFGHYKDLEPGKWVKMKGWGSAADAAQAIAEAITRAGTVQRDG